MSLEVDGIGDNGRKLNGTVKKLEWEKRKK